MTIITFTYRGDSALQAATEQSHLLVILALMAIVSSIAAEQTKVTICHKGKNTLTVAEPAAAAHYAHGDAPGAYAEVAA